MLLLNEFLLKREPTHNVSALRKQIEANNHI